MKLSAVAQQKVIEKTTGEAIWVNPTVTFYWDKSSEKLTGVVLPEDRNFNEVEQALVDFYENRLTQLKTLEEYVKKYQYENAKFRILGKSLLSHYHSTELEDLVYRKNIPFDGPVEQEAIKESEVILKSHKDSTCSKD